MRLKLVAIDLDETLLRLDKSYDIKRFDKLVDVLSKQGVTFLVSSGNYIDKIVSYLSKKTLEKIYIAGDNGNRIEQAGEHIHTYYIDFDSLMEVSDLVDADDDLQMIVNSPKNIYSKYIYEKDKQFIDLFFTISDIKLVDSYANLPADEPLIKGGILSTKSIDDTKKIVNKINNEIKGLFAVTSGEGWFTVFNEEGGKSAAIKWLQSKKGISIEETIAFGDSLNDAPMMAHAKYSVAMENADEDLKEKCNYVIGTNEDQAVINILEKYYETGNMKFIEKYKKS